MVESKQSTGCDIPRVRGGNVVQVILGGVVVVGVTVAAGGHRFTRCDHQHSYQHFHCALIKGERKKIIIKTLIGKRVSRRTGGQNE